MMVAVLIVSISLLTTLTLCINQHLAAVLLLCHLVPLQEFQICTLSWGLHVWEVSGLAVGLTM